MKVSIDRTGRKFENITDVDKNGAVLVHSTKNLVDAVADKDGAVNYTETDPVRKVTAEEGIIADDNWATVMTGLVDKARDANVIYDKKEEKVKVDNMYTRKLILDEGLDDDIDDELGDEFDDEFDDEETSVVGVTKEKEAKQKDFYDNGIHKETGKYNLWFDKIKAQERAESNKPYDAGDSPYTVWNAVLNRLTNNESIDDPAGSLCYRGGDLIEAVTIPLQNNKTVEQLQKCFETNQVVRVPRYANCTVRTAIDLPFYNHLATPVSAYSICVLLPTDDSKLIDEICDLLKLPQRDVPEVASYYHAKRAVLITIGKRIGEQRLFARAKELGLVVEAKRTSPTKTIHRIRRP